MHKQLGDACSSCGRTDVRFNANKYQCVECIAQYAKEAYRKDPEKFHARVRAWIKKKAVQDPTTNYRRNKARGWKWSYGLTFEDVQNLIEFQQGLCPICRQPLTACSSKHKQTQIEHDHLIMSKRGIGSIATKRASIRGVTCGSCNLMLGHAHDNIQTLRNAIAYLERANSLKLIGAGAADCYVSPGVDWIAFATGQAGNLYATEEPMIAAIETPNEFHVLLHVGRKGLKAVATTYCGEQHDASNGTVQIPDRVVMDNVPWRKVSPGSGQGSILKPCQKCLLASK